LSSFGFPSPSSAINAMHWDSMAIILLGARFPIGVTLLFEIAKSFTTQDYFERGLILQE